MTMERGIMDYVAELESKVRAKNHELVKWKQYCAFVLIRKVQFWLGVVVGGIVVGVSGASLIVVEWSRILLSHWSK